MLLFWAVRFLAQASHGTIPVFPVTLVAASLCPCWRVAPLSIESTKPKVPGLILLSSFSLISSSRQWPDPVSSVFNAVDIAPLFSTSTLCGWVEAIIISCLGPTESPHLQSVVHIVSRVRFLKANLVLSLPSVSCRAVKETNEVGEDLQEI